MKVLNVITSLNTGGAEKLITDSLCLYHGKGIDVDLLVLQENGSVFEKNLKEKFLGNVFFLGKGSPYNPLHIFNIILKIKKYDVIHIHLFPALYWVVLAKLFCESKIKLVYTEHNTHNRRRELFFFKLVDRFIYSKLDFIGCISDATKKNLLKHLDYKRKNIEVISNGIELSNFEANSSIEKPFFDCEDFVLIQVSSFRAQKDQATVIRALPLIPINIKLLLVGEGSLRRQCEELAVSLGVSERVVFLGNRMDIPQLFKYSSLAIQSSNYEGFGLVAVEAMAAGKAVVVSDVDGLSNVVKDYGVLFPKGDYEALAKEILKFYLDIEYKVSIEEKCKLRSKDFDINSMVATYIDIYKKVWHGKEVS